VDPQTLAVDPAQLREVNLAMNHRATTEVARKNNAPHDQNLWRNSWLGFDSLQDVGPHFADEVVSFWRRHFVRRVPKALAVCIDRFDHIIGWHWVSPLGPS